MECRICGCQTGHTSYHVEEKMFGLGDVFQYVQCGNCECLQIAEPLDNTAKYYPERYYSFENLRAQKKTLARVKAIKDKIVVVGRLGQSTFFERLIRPELRAVARLKLSKASRIIDAGCGAGALLKDMCDMGFKNILGVDPYVANDIEYGNGCKTVRSPLYDVQGKWDVVMFHHSFEHIFEQYQTLASVSRLLDKGGACLIRVPMVSSYAWRHYRENWVQLDAPRHIYLHSLKSMHILAENSGFSIQSVRYDSTAFQFWGSELYTRGISLVAPERNGLATRDIYFSRKEIRDFEMQARQLNAINEGDQAAFVLRRV